MSDQAIIALMGLVSSGIVLLFTYFFKNIKNSVEELSHDLNIRLSSIEKTSAEIEKTNAVLMTKLDLYQRDLNEMKKDCRKQHTIQKG